VIAQIDGSRLAEKDVIHYLPEDVSMICFIQIAFHQLRTSNHHSEYGKFGIVLTNKFLKDNFLHPVYYYSEESLYHNPAILKWNYGNKSGKLTQSERHLLEEEITSYRKPIRLFSDFEKSITHIINFNNGKTPKTDCFTYNRYPIGYDFSQENEYRIVIKECLSFKETDLFMIIVPDHDSKDIIDNYLNKNWIHKPKVELYPQ
jgi:hypothetical protein